jgi:glycosyltransferase involved in cell wall biosynthesis
MLTSLQIGDHYPQDHMSGLSRVYVELIRALPPAGVEVHGMALGPTDVFEKTAGVVTPFADSHNPLWKRLILARGAVRSLTRQYKIDLIASHFALYSAFPDAIAKDIPLVVHFHGPWAGESAVEKGAAHRNWLKLILERHVYQRAKRLIVLSESFKTELLTHYGIDEELVRIVPGGIDVDRFNVTLSRAQARKKLGWPEDRPILLTVRRQVRRMGLENLIDAARNVILRFPEFLVYIGGTGPIADELEKRIDELNLNNNVRLLGRISEEMLPLAYRAADFTIVPSQFLEGFGMTSLESLASGTPVLVTPVGGLPEVIRPFSPQCICSDTSVDAITATILDMLREPAKLPNEADCRAYAVQNFAWQRIAEKVRRVYEEAVK